MFKFMKKKKTEEDIEKIEDKAFESVKTSEKSSNQPEMLKVTTDIERLKAGFESFQEIRKAFNERFEMISEQVGELRAMIMDRDKTMQEIELKAIKSADLVASVQPEKLSILVQKQEAKTEALKANIEGNEAMIERVLEELKETKRKIEFFRGIEEIINLSEEIKKELIEIKKVEATIKINTDKVQTIYLEIRKRFDSIEVVKDSLKEIEVNIEQNTREINSLKDKITEFADKTQVESIVSKVQKYVDSLKSLEKESSLTKDIEKLKSIMKDLKS
jgi:chromosome segregation ATPase